MDYFVKAYKDWKLHSQFHEIVDMEDDYIFNEKQSIRDSARSLKKYGSTCCNHVRNQETLVRHDIEKTDTLQGIALKYGCTTEQIRRANRLFASDSLFLRQYLLVPVEKSSPYFPPSIDEQRMCVNGGDTPSAMCGTTNSNDSIVTTSHSSQATSSSATSTEEDDDDYRTSKDPRPGALPARPYSIAGELLPDSTDAHTHNNHNNNNHSGSGGNTSKSLDSVAAMTPEEENRKCINDFLSKIDSTISESRKYVERSKEMITSQSENDLFGTTTTSSGVGGRGQQAATRGQLRQLQTSHMRTGSSGSGSDTAHLLNTTQTRRVQNSLKRLEQQQDEFFEL